eukprot:TRINITY_DN2902_c0_g2_i1.p1 TRINITY_DN2902_c0_g2~~TRINITY_DN2902_c0_g2_i1.p1  ORF type:complete len:208 (-),score=40.04 TRINITY_DN2902_c0_g2_i1:159-782(-)
MRGFRSGDNLSDHSLKIQSLASSKKTRSFSSTAIEKSKQCNSDHSRYSEAGEKNVQLFARVSKGDNESIETLSEEGERNEAAADSCNQCESNAIKLEDIDIAYPKIIIAPCSDMISKAAETSKLSAPKKQWLFADFNERFVQRKKSIEEHKRMREEKERELLAEGIVEKHPNLIPQSPKMYTKSAFSFTKTEEAAVSSVEHHNVLFN